MTRLVLASASPARLRLLRDAGTDPEVRVSGVDEAGLLAGLDPAERSDPERHCLALARAKARTVAATLPAADALVVGCDSVLDVDGVAYGKPASAGDAIHRWRTQLSGRSAVLRTGHWVVRTGPDGAQTGAVAATTVTFATVSEDEIAAYVGTGEPLGVAGAFTLDGRGGAFVRRVAGDPSTVVGLSLPLLRDLVDRLGVRWIDLWSPAIPARGGPR